MASSVQDRIAGVIGDFAYKAPCRVVATTPIVTSGTQTIDGVALAVLDRVLVTGQADTTLNGIYTVDTGAWELAPDFLSSQSVARGSQVFITDGTTNQHTIWYIVATNPVNPQTPTSPSAITAAKLSTGGGTPGGTANQIQYNAAGVFGGFTMTGDATLVVATGVITIANSAVTNAKMANMNAHTYKGNNTGSAAAPADIAAASVATDIGAAILSAANAFTKSQAGPTAALTLTTGHFAWDASAVQIATVNMSGNATLDNPTNLAVGTYIVIATQSGGGSHTLDYGNKFKWPGGTPPTLSTGATAVDVLCFVSDGTSLYGASQLNFS